MKLPVVSADGKEIRKVDVDDTVFGITPNAAVLHQAYVRQRANQRAGTVMTKTRGEVQGSTRKIRMQKYTGRARQGSNRSPTRVGGGVIFGPRPRDYTQAMPKKMRRLAIRSALSGKLADGQLVVIDALALDTPKTREIVRILGNVGLNRSALVVTAEADRAVHASVKNLARVESLPAAYLNVGDMMNHAGLLMTEQAVKIAEALWGQKGQTKKASDVVPRRAAKKAEEPESAPAAPVAERATAVEAEKPAPKRRAAAKTEAPSDAPEKPKRAAKPKAAAKPRTTAKKADAGDKPAARPRKRTTTKKAEEETGS